MCFGVLFLLWYLFEYGNLFKDLIVKYGVICWLVNIGWIGGVYGIGNWMLIKVICILF